jgi:alpha-glucosidase (family GH31 glycosyl hydrolase)
VSRFIRCLSSLVVLVACGDDTLPRVPERILVGPVTITTATMTIGVGGKTVDGFLRIGVVDDDIDESHYYDPRGDDLVTFRAPKARHLDGDWIVLDGGVKFRVTECEGMGRTCAILDVDASNAERAVQMQLALPHEAGEPVFGTGDAPRTPNVAGTVREMQLRVDAKSDSSLNETHVPVPLLMWPVRRVGWFIADDRPAALDAAATTPTEATATFTLPVRGSYRSYIFTNGGDPLDLVRTYVALTTLPAVPPRWAFAPQQWRNVHNSSAEVYDDANEMRTRKIPGSLMWIDNPWQTGYNTFVVDEARIAGAEQLIADLDARGYHVLFWSTPYVGTTPVTAADRAEGLANDFFITDDTGRVLDVPWQNGPGAMVDFTRPGAIEWWRGRIKRVVDIGARGFKLDFGEEVVSDISGTILPMLLAAGDNSSHHNRYSAGYHEAYLGALPPGDQYLITRAGAWGEQNVNPSIWPGDLDSDFSQFGDVREGKTNVGGMPSAISRGLSLSLSGYPFYGSDIGGFKGFPTTEVLLRWAAYAAYGTIMQLGGGGKSHNPWDTTLFDAGADVIYKKFADLHMQLNPLLWTLAQKAGLDGTPITVPAKFICRECDDTAFFLGRDLFIAPVIEAGATTRTVVLPLGAWVNRESGEIHSSDGKTSFTVPAPLDVIPTWQRIGSFVPMFARYADTMLPATAPGVTSYADPMFSRELRLVFVPDGNLENPAGVELFDGSSIGTGGGGGYRIVGGGEYSVFTLDVDARSFPDYQTVASAKLGTADLPNVADVTTCAAPGCWSYNATTKRLLVRVFVAQYETRDLALMF